jgi:hypothetical protein
MPVRQVKVHGRNVWQARFPGGAFFAEDETRHLSDGPRQSSVLVGDPRTEGSLHLRLHLEEKKRLRTCRRSERISERLET